MEEGGREWGEGRKNKENKLTHHPAHHPSPSPMTHLLSHPNGVVLLLDSFGCSGMPMLHHLLEKLDSKK